MHHPFADLVGLRFEAEREGHSICSVDVDARLLNPHRVVHGGVMFTLADTGMGMALYPSLGPGELCATIEIKISYLRPVRQGTLTCATEVVSRGKSVAHMESSIHNGDALVARASGSYAIFRPRSAGDGSGT